MWTVCAIFAMMAPTTASPQPVSNDQTTTVTLDAAELKKLPIVMLVINGAWEMWIGSESPAFALYEDGRVIMEDRSPKSEAPFRTRLLAAGERDALLKQIGYGQFDGLKDSEFVGLSGPLQVSDQPMTHVYFRRGTELKLLSVYAMNLQPKPYASGSSVDLVDRVMQLGGSLPEKAMIPWHPETITVGLWDFSHAKPPGVVWPTTLPFTTIKTPDPDRVYLSVPWSSRGELTKLNRQLSDGRTPVIFEGRKMTMAWRLGLPGESALGKWGRNLSTAQEKTK